jgi:hypothetical protein
MSSSVSFSTTGCIIEEFIPCRAPVLKQVIDRTIHKSDAGYLCKAIEGFALSIWTYFYPLNFSLEPRSISTCGRQDLGSQTRRARVPTRLLILATRDRSIFWLVIQPISAESVPLR